MTSLSRLGVKIYGLPRAEMVSNRWSSENKKRILGLIFLDLHVKLNRPGSVRAAEPIPARFKNSRRVWDFFFMSWFFLLYIGVNSFCVKFLIDSCVLKTVLDAFELGYEVIVPADCCASPIPDAHKFILQYLQGFKFPTPTVKELVKSL